MENVVNLIVDYQECANYAEFTVKSIKRETVIDFLCKKIVSFRIQKGDSEFTTTIDFEKKTIEREEELTHWLEMNFDDIELSNYKNYLIEGFENNVDEYIRSLSENDCREISFIYYVAKSHDTYNHIEWIFKDPLFSYICLMSDLQLQIENNKADNLLKLYNYMVGEEFHTEGEDSIKITNSIFMKVFKKDYTMEYEEDNRKDKISSITLIKLFSVKDTIKLNQLQQKGICLSDSRGIVLVPESNIQTHDSTLFCSIRDKDNNIFFEFYYTLLM